MLKVDRFIRVTKKHLSCELVIPVVQLFDTEIKAQLAAVHLKDLLWSTGKWICWVDRSAEGKEAVLFHLAIQQRLDFAVKFKRLQNKTVTT